MGGLPPEKERSAEVIGLDKRQLLVRHRNGDPSAFPELVEHFRRQIFSYLIRCGIEEASRDDLFQEIFLTIHRYAANYKPELALNPWIFTIVANTVRSWYRKQQIQKITTDPMSHDDLQHSENIHDQSVARETASWLENTIRQLPFQQREVLLLCCVKGLRQEEVASVLRMPLNSLKTHLRRARIELARRLIQRNARIEHEVSS